MALSKGAKIAIGCVAVFILACIATGIVVVSAGYWALGKTKQVVQGLQADTKQIDQDLKQANANPFTPPTDGVITESQLTRFLAVRKTMYGAYAKHKDMIEAQSKKKDADLSALAQLPGILMELRATKAHALAAQGMSEAEFTWMVGAVYRNLAAASVSKETNGAVSEAVRTTGDQVVEAAEKAAAAAEADPNVPPEAKEKLREAARQAREQAQAAVESSKVLDVPPANMALFKKHQDEIQQYTMGGLELLPL